MNKKYNFKLFTSCNNCGKRGHTHYQCNDPIISSGIICYREKDGIREYLMIRRKDTLGYVDFIRGKYQLHNNLYLHNIFNEMTQEEKERIKQHNFNELWNILWGSNFRNKHKNEYFSSEKKFLLLKNNKYITDTMNSLDELLEKTTTWKEQEWGFPKGRKNPNESDIDTALREFTEETGYNKQDIRVIMNMKPYEEIFTGSNFKCYIHKYYIAKLVNNTYDLNKFQKSEVSDIKWFNYEDCISKIREYNIERIDILKNVDDVLNNYMIL